MREYIFVILLDLEENKKKECYIAGVYDFFQNNNNNTKNN